MGIHVFPILNPTSHLRPHPIPLGHPSAPALSILYHASNLDWRFTSHIIIYMFQCHSPKPSHPRPLSQSPKDCSIRLCLFCCLPYRIIVTIFLNSICISILYWQRRQWHPTPVPLAWKISWTEELVRLQSMGSLRVEHD